VSIVSLLRNIPQLASMCGHGLVGLRSEAMLFLSRSVLCIGVVATAAAGGGPDLQTAVSGAGRGLAQHLGRACSASLECQRVGITLASAAARSTTALPKVQHPSADTSQAPHVAPGWSAPPSGHGSGRASSVTSSMVSAVGKPI